MSFGEPFIRSPTSVLDTPVFFYRQTLFGTGPTLSWLHPSRFLIGWVLASSEVCFYIIFLDNHSFDSQHQTLHDVFTHPSKSD